MASVAAFFGRLIGVVLLVSGLMPRDAFAASPIALDGTEAGLSLRGGIVLWHDPGGTAGFAEARKAFAAGEFAEPDRHGSTGLAPGAFWSRFLLQNTTQENLDLRLEYIDHQLIELSGFQAGVGDGEFSQLVDLTLEDAFGQRPVPHHRFVIPARVAAGETAEFFVRYGSHQMGFVFPELRIWSPAALAMSQAKELAVINFVVGGLLVMALISLIGGVGTGVSYFYIYSLHAIASAAVWFTVLGYTHQFLLTESFHWRYMSMTGALSLFTGLYFAREFLRTRTHAPRFDRLLLFMIFNAVFLFLVAMAEQTALAVISITLALLMYPLVSIAGLVRWYQGARAAGLFTLAWTFLVVGLFLQALRDLGLVEHNLLNYYWPALASYGEMAVILVAMGISIQDLRAQKETAEQGRMLQLQETQLMLEAQVAERTKALVAAKTAAEREARTDTLTGIDNRRSFMKRGQMMLERCRRAQLPLNLLMMDIDHFKEVNDSYGHEVGDRALMRFAESLKTLFRDRDLFGRIGGEEFALLLICGPTTALKMAERLRDEVRRVEVATDSGPLGFTISVGVAHLEAETRIEELLKQADQALYIAKASGRDRVALAPARDQGAPGRDDGAMGQTVPTMASEGE